MFPGYDMLNLQRDQRRVALPALAILTRFRCPAANRSPSLGIHGLKLSVCQTKTGFSLEDGKQVVGLDVAFVFRLLDRRQIAVVGLFRQFGQTFFESRIALQLGKPLRLLGSQ